MAEPPKPQTPPENGNQEETPITDPDTQVFSIPSTREIIELETDTLRQLHKLAFVFERLQLSEYISMLQNTRRLIFLNFIAGLARGFGVIIGMTVLMAIFLYILGRLVDAPLFGKYVASFIAIVQHELARMGRKF
jgi:hypothetical protein